MKFPQQSLEYNKCDKKFKSHMKLREHIKNIHEKKFVCVICGEKFDISHQLNKLIEYSHEKNFKMQLSVWKQLPFKDSCEKNS